MKSKLLMSIKSLSCSEYCFSLAGSSSTIYGFGYQINNFEGIISLTKERNI